VGSALRWSTAFRLQSTLKRGLQPSCSSRRTNINWDQSTHSATAGEPRGAAHRRYPILAQSGTSRWRSVERQADRPERTLPEPIWPFENPPTAGFLELFGNYLRLLCVGGAPLRPMAGNDKASNCRHRAVMRRIWPAFQVWRDKQVAAPPVSGGQALWAIRGRASGRSREKFLDRHGTVCRGGASKAPKSTDRSCAVGKSEGWDIR
jgi:hypothetical protein